MNTRQLCFAHAVYMDTVRFAMECGVGSRGSALVLDQAGTPVHAGLDDCWRQAPEDENFRAKTLVTVADAAGQVRSRWESCRQIPRPDTWFETAWERFRDGAIYDRVCGK